jgi:hypothetical protein
VLPTLRVPDGLTIAPFPSETAGQRGVGDLIPDNGICERSTKLCSTSFTGSRSAKKLYGSIDELQVDLDLWVRDYNERRPIKAAGASEDPGADLPGRNSDDQGEIDRSLIPSDSKTRSLNQVPTVREELGGEVALQKALAVLGKIVE